MTTLPQEITLDVGLDEPTDEAHLRTRAAKLLRTSVNKLPVMTLRKKSIDARRGSVRFHLLFELGADPERDLAAPHPREVKGNRVLVVGDGPTGLFCAYQLARAGIGCTVIDRGKTVQPRRHDLAGLNKRGVVDPDSNYCFGEGGAGTYSDGKLYTRAHKRGSVRDVIEVLARHGAPEAILTDARPHIGSNQLPRVVTSLRTALENVGVTFEFGARVVDVLTHPQAALAGGVRRIAGVKLSDGRELGCDFLVLATGHSASDIYTMFAERGVTLEAKSCALGVRIEHPQPLINEIQYGAFAKHPALPAAPYRLAHTEDQRGVFSFCMCPGGFIVPASTVPEGLVVNGMSLSRRSSHYANSGLVVGIEPEDVKRAGFDGVLGGIAFQRTIEAAALQAGGGMLRAPATRATDFVQGIGSSTMPSTSYLPGVHATNVAEVLDCTGLALSPRLRDALVVFNRKMRGYLTEDAILVGVESRTSSPVRIPRDPDTLQSPDIAGLYPAGEGAGYAGGIMSAAMDGIRIAQELTTQIGSAVHVEGV